MNIQPMPQQQGQGRPPVQLPDDITSLYGEENDPHQPPPGELASMLQNELDGIATGIVQMEQQETQIKKGLAAARGLARGLEREIHRLRELAADEDLKAHEEAQDPQ